jgi:hypothetical protein
MPFDAASASRVRCAPIGDGYGEHPRQLCGPHVVEATDLRFRVQVARHLRKTLAKRRVGSHKLLRGQVRRNATTANADDLADSPEDVTVVVNDAERIRRGSKAVRPNDDGGMDVSRADPEALSVGVERTAQQRIHVKTGGSLSW